MRKVDITKAITVAKAKESVKVSVKAHRKVRDFGAPIMRQDAWNMFSGFSNRYYSNFKAFSKVAHRLAKKASTRNFKLNSHDEYSLVQVDGAFSAEWINGSRGIITARW